MHQRIHQKFASNLRQRQNFDLKNADHAHRCAIDSERAGRFDEAREQFEQAYRYALEKKLANKINEFGQSYAIFLTKRNDYESAIDIFRNIPLNEKNIFILKFYIQSLTKTDQLDEAYEVYKNALQKIPDNAELYLSYALFLHAQKNFYDA